jgi:NAD-dependent SIR2 family protein deacetylase
MSAVFRFPEYKRIDSEIDGNVECCAQCEEPKFPLVRERGEGGCVNPMCVAFGEQQASVAFHGKTETILNLQARLNQLREWMLSQGYEVVFREKDA